MNEKQDAVPMEIEIIKLPISEISDKELSDTLSRVIAEHKDAVKSIHDSMEDATYVYKKYLNPNYVPDEKTAKADRAELNKAEKIIGERFATLKAAYEKPLLPMEAEIKAIRNAIKEAAEVPYKAVTVYKEMQDKKKRQEINDYFITKKFDLVPLERLWNPKWLNKTMEMHDIAKEIDEAIAKIYGDIQVLERIPEHGMMAKAVYLRTLDMGAALREVDALKENAARLAQEEVNRQQRQMQEQCDRNAAAQRKEEREKEKEAIIQSKIDEAVGLPQGTTAAETKAAVLKYTLTFEGTEEQLMKLRKFMSEQGIPYQKGLVFDTPEQAKQIAEKRNYSGKIMALIYAPAA